LNRQHPFVEVLFSDITESGEALNLSELVREPLPPAFHRLEICTANRWADVS